MAKPRLLDLFCCEGGAGMGYHRAGFEVVGVDLMGKYKRRYPFEFVQADALEYLADNAHKFDVIHGSPPCQKYSITNAARKADYPDLVAPLRKLMQESGKPYVIENVVGAPLTDPLVLCGTMFGLQADDDDGTRLRLQRHRLFESNVELSAPSECDHSGDMPWAGSYGGARRDRWEAKHVRKGGYVPSAEVQSQLLGIDWMTQRGMWQSIPPAYTEHLGKQLLDIVL